MLSVQCPVTATCRFQQSLLVADARPTLGDYRLCPLPAAGRLRVRIGRTGALVLFSCVPGPGCCCNLLCAGHGRLPLLFSGCLPRFRVRKRRWPS